MHTSKIVFSRECVIKFHIYVHIGQSEVCSTTYDYCPTGGSSCFAGHCGSTLHMYCYIYHQLTGYTDKINTLMVCGLHPHVVS